MAEIEWDEMKLTSRWCAESWETSVAKEWTLLESQIAGSSGQWYKVDYHSIPFSNWYEFTIFVHFFNLRKHLFAIGQNPIFGLHPQLFSYP